MARNKETLVILLDVGPTMHQHLEYMSKAVSALVHRKLLHNRFDEVGVAYFGADDTDNPLSDTLEGYENIVVSRVIAVIADDLVRTVDNLPRGSALSDFLSAVVVGMDMIVTKLGPNSKGNKRICLITAGETLVKDPDEGTKEGQVVTLADQMQQHGVSLDAVVIRLRGPGNSLQSKASQENEFLLRKLASRTKGELILTETYTSLLGAIRTRQVSPTTIYRGDLEVTPNMSVKVWVYKKVSPERVPTLKLYSDLETDKTKAATHLVTLETDYKSAHELKPIPPEQRVKAYKYGQQFVPISSMHEDFLKFKTEKGLKLIGFTDSSNIPRHYSMNQANVFIPEPGNVRSTVAVSSLVRALAETQKVAIVRCVWRVNQTSVVLGVLTPNLSSDDGVADCFYFNILPFAEDLRDYVFASFNDLPPPQQPTSVQQEAADALVQMMDLAPPSLEEMLRPERTINPVLQRFYSVLHLKSVDPDAKVPPLDDALRRIMEPDQSYLSANESSLQSFSQQFTLSYNIQKEKGRKFWREGLEGGEANARLPGAGEEGPEQMEDQKPLSLEFLTNKKVEDVGSVNPVEDFEAMMARRDSDQWIPRAIKGMKKIISDLLSSAYNGNTYQKAMACLVVLRAGCVMQEEPKDFNEFLEEVAEKCLGKRLNDFWQQLVAQNVTLISKDEAPDRYISSLTKNKDVIAEGTQEHIIAHSLVTLLIGLVNLTSLSEVTQDEAVAFLSGRTNPSKDVKEEDVDEMEALFDDII